MLNLIYSQLVENLSRPTQRGGSEGFQDPMELPELQRGLMELPEA